MNTTASIFFAKAKKNPSKMVKKLKEVIFIYQKSQL